MTQLPTYLTVDQVAQRFQVTAETAREWARSGRVPSIRTPGGQYRFSRDVIDAMAPEPAPAAQS